MFSKDAALKLSPTSAQAVWFLLWAGLLSLPRCCTDSTRILMAAKSCALRVAPMILVINLTVKMKKKAKGESYVAGK